MRYLKEVPYLPTGVRRRCRHLLHLSTALHHLVSPVHHCHLDSNAVSMQNITPHIAMRRHDVRRQHRSSTSRSSLIHNLLYCASSSSERLLFCSLTLCLSSSTTLRRRRHSPCHHRRILRRPYRILHLPLSHSRIPSPGRRSSLPATYALPFK